MYCVQCGVELEKGEIVCPLCGLKVYHPELEKEISEESKDELFPSYEETPEVSRHGILFIITFLFLIPVVVCLLTDLAVNRHIIWSGYVVVSLAAVYVMICLPLWFRRQNPVIFFPIHCAAILLVALYICLKTGGHWFLTFAFPVGAVLEVIIETEIVLLRYVKKGQLFVFGGAFIALGLTIVLIEFLLKETFGIEMLWWSLIPLAVLFIVGMMLIVIGISRPLRESLQKRFFI